MIILPCISVLYIFMFSCFILEIVSLWGCPYLLFSPHIIIAIFGVIAERKEEVVEVRLPWCPTFNICAFILSKEERIEVSAASSASPVKRYFTSSYCINITTEQLLRS